MLIFEIQRFAEDAPADGGFATSISAETSESIGSDSQVAPDTERSFEDLIKNEYKEDYSRHVQEAISKRFKNQRDNQEIIDRMNPLLSSIGAKYGVKARDDGSIDYEEMARVLEDDDSLYEEEAFRTGKSTSEIKLEKQNQRLKEQIERTAEEARNRAEFDKLYNEGMELKKVYQNFDLNVEMENPDVRRLIFSGVPLRTAYEVVHKDEILAGGMQYAVQQTQSKISKSIQSGMRRPAENGTGGTSAGDAGAIDPTKFTRKDFERIKREAERGARITF